MFLENTVCLFILLLHPIFSLLTLILLVYKAIKNNEMRLYCLYTNNLPFFKLLDLFFALTFSLLILFCSSPNHHSVNYCSCLFFVMLTWQETISSFSTNLVLGAHFIELNWKIEDLSFKRIINWHNFSLHLTLCEFNFLLSTHRIQSK